VMTRAIGDQPGHPSHDSRHGDDPSRPAVQPRLGRDARTRPSGRGWRDIAGEPRW